MQQDNGVVAEANRLYWESELSVGAIADQLGISRRALYEALDPEPAGAPCPDCGAELVFANRSAQIAGEAQCRGCGLEADVPFGMRPPSARADRNGQFEVPDAPENEQEATAGPAAPLDVEALALRERAVMLGGAALAGLVVGALAAFAATRR
jgi:hypothetical protein